MALSLINKDITPDAPYSLIFLTSPVKLPVKHTGLVCAPEVAEDHHFSSVVWVRELSDFAVFEFDKQTFHALSAYKSRNESLSLFYIIVDRLTSGKLRLAIERHSLDPALLEEKIKTVTEMNKKLLDFYLKKKDYTVFELKGKV